MLTRRNGKLFEATICRCDELGLPVGRHDPTCPLQHDLYAEAAARLLNRAAPPVKE